MPYLQNPRHEAFAQARAKGARLEDAYEDAGFTPGHGHSSRLALQPLVAERIAELRALNVALTNANPALTIASLLHLADLAPGFGGAASVREARLALLDAGRVHAQWERTRELDRKRLHKVEITQENEPLDDDHPSAETAETSLLTAEEPPTDRQPTAI